MLLTQHQTRVDHCLTQHEAVVFNNDGVVDAEQSIMLVDARIYFGASTSIASPSCNGPEPADGPKRPICGGELLGVHMPLRSYTWNIQAQ